MLPAFAKEGFDLVGTFNFDGRFSEALATHGYLEVSDQGGDDELYRIENDVYVQGCLVRAKDKVLSQEGAKLR
eukprot:1208566-Rhodomonas_salina.1